jgi:hypothetical protein
VGFLGCQADDEPVDRLTGRAGLTERAVADDPLIRPAPHRAFPEDSLMAGEDRRERRVELRHVLAHAVRE